MTLNELIQKAESSYSPQRAEHSKYFFKTGPGQYGEGDIFWGLSVPEMRKLAKACHNLAFEDIALLIADKVHELRLIGLTILVEQYEKAKTEVERKTIYDFYLNHRKGINNWDLVDLSVYKIIGDYLVKHRGERAILYRFIKSENMWDRRMAMVSTMAFIRKGESEDVLRLAELLFSEKEDLMHKAAGWMLRELGKRNEAVLCDFLDKHSHKMPRTMLRYAIERFPEEKRQKYLQTKRTVFN